MCHFIGHFPKTFDLRRSVLLLEDIVFYSHQVRKIRIFCYYNNNCCYFAVFKVTKQNSHETILYIQEF